MKRTGMNKNVSHQHVNCVSNATLVETVNTAANVAFNMPCLHSGRDLPICFVTMLTLALLTDAYIYRFLGDLKGVFRYLKEQIFRVCSTSRHCRNNRYSKTRRNVESNNIPTQRLPERGHDSVLPLLRMRPPALR